MSSNYQQLQVWQRGMEIVRQVYRMTRSLPKHEVFGLSSQMQRAAVSIPANIAEGHARGTTKEYLRYVGISHGSLAELETMLLIALDLQYVSPRDRDELAALCDSTGSLRRALANKLRTPKSRNP